MDLLLLLRSLEAPELKIAPGRALMARVVSADAHGHGTLSIAGALIEAGLPKHVRAGDELRLMVKEVSDEKVVLSLAEQAVPPAPEPVPLPGGGRVAVSERDAATGGAAGSAAHTVALRYDAPSLGPVDLRFQLDSASLRLSVTLPEGEPWERASAAAEELRGALADSLPRAISVTISPRHEPVEVYA